MCIVLVAALAALVSTDQFTTSSGTKSLQSTFSGIPEAVHQMHLSAAKVLRTRQPALAHCPSNARRPSARLQHRAAIPSDGEDALDWNFDSLDSDDLALPGFSVPGKSKKAEGLNNCYGCGVQLQTESPRTPGYVNEDTLEVKNRHGQRNSILCSRCVPCSSSSGRTAAYSKTTNCTALEIAVLHCIATACFILHVVQMPSSFARGDGAGCERLQLPAKPFAGRATRSRGTVPPHH